MCAFAAANKQDVAHHELALTVGDEGKFETCIPRRTVSAFTSLLIYLIETFVMTRRDQSQSCQR
jgi:hypothetical protein